MKNHPCCPTLITLLLVSFICHGQAQAKKIFLLVAADTSADSGIALSTGPDMDYIQNVFVGNVPERQLVVYGNIPNWQNENTPDLDDENTPDWNEEHTPNWDGPNIYDDLGDMKNKLLTAIDKCPAGHDDTIVFFYSGHGAYDKTQGHYLQMPDQKTKLLRKTIIEKIQKKKPRLAVVITDSCNTLFPLISPLSFCAPAACEPAACELQIESTISPLFDELFFKTKGLIDINASSKDQVAAGPVGGGLLVLALAHKGDHPEFQAVSSKAIDIIKFTKHTSDVAIPPVDYWSVIWDACEQTTQDPGLKTFDEKQNTNFNASIRPYGFLWGNTEQRLSWTVLQKEVSKKMDHLFEEVRTSKACIISERQKTQTPQFYSFPLRKPTRNLPRTLSLSHNDIIVKINGENIFDASACRQAIADSGKNMTFTVRDSRDGTFWEMQTTLGSEEVRFGIELDDEVTGGARVTKVWRGYPSTRNQVVDRLDTIPAYEVARWSAPTRSPRPGDHIVEVNGFPVFDADSFRQAIKFSPEIIMFVVANQRTGKHSVMRTKLKSSTAKFRFGMDVSDSEYEGVRVDRVWAKWPGSRCQAGW